MGLLLAYLTSLVSAFVAGALALTLVLSVTTPMVMDSHSLNPLSSIAGRSGAQSQAWNSRCKLLPPSHLSRQPIPK